MLKNFKKFVAVMALFTTFMAQTSAVFADTSTNSVGSDYCQVYDCSSGTGSQDTGSTNTGNSYVTGNTGSTNTGTTPTKSVGSSYCDVYDCSGMNGSGTTGTSSYVSGNTGSAPAPTPTKSVGSAYCDVYDCSSVGSSGGTGNGGNTSGGSAPAPTPTKSVGSAYCDVYDCTSVGPGVSNGGNNNNGGSGSNGGSTPAPTPTKPLPPGAFCDVYTPCVSQCNDHKYPKDIDGHWAEIYVRRLYDLCIFEGYPDGTFRPNQNITRAELTKIALFAAGIKPNPGCYDADCGSPFVDLDMWQGQWVRPAWDRKIVQGFGNYFQPNRAITRAEATKIILSAYGFGPLNTDKSFFNDVSGWATGWIEQAHELGIVQGIGNGNFDPERPITRAEAAKIIAKSIEKEDTTITN